MTERSQEPGDRGQPPSAASSESASEEVLRLRRELAQAQRAERQAVRRAERSESMSRQSQGVMQCINADLAVARREAELAAEVKGRFLATMSHELRTPMNGILGALDLISKSGLVAEQIDLIDVVQRSAESLLVLLDDILDFSKIEAGKLDLERVPYSLERLLRDLLELQRPVAERCGLELQLEIDPALPSTVSGDPARLRQVLLNLLSNALKFTEVGAVTVRVDMVDTEHMRFAVTDTGPGMSADVVGTVFEAFTQGDDGTTRRFGGTGLGLAITRRLVGLMGGEIRVRSVVGVGTHFEFDVEIGRSLEQPRRERDRRPEVAAEPVDFVGMHCLVVDDNPVNRMVACRMLNKLGCTTDVAVNGQQAVDCVASQQFDVVFMDGSMPVLDGYQATAEIRKLPEPAQSVRISAMTAHAMRGDRERCLEAGMDDYVAKPVRISDLVDALARARESTRRAA